MLAFPPVMGKGAALFHTAEVSEIDGVFFFAFFAKDHFMTGNVREDTLDEVTAIWAIDVTQS